MIKAVIFDIGKTLISYKNPLNWSVLYRPALEHVAQECFYDLSEEQIQNAMNVLTKYNTRINPREYEVSSDTIFREIITVWNTPTEDIEKVKECFYLFFRHESQPYEDVEATLQQLKDMDILTGALSDVAYGMDNKYVFEDIEPIKELIDYPFTSNDIGYRKPNIKGLEVIADKIGIHLTEIAYVGDEEKDIICANNAGACSVLINRDKTKKEFGQQHEIHIMTELIDIIKSKNSNSNISVRAEEEKDHRQVEEVTRLAFSYPDRIERGGIGCPYEHWMVHELRKRDGILPLSLVAEVNGTIVGHIICSEAIVKTSGYEIPVLNFGPLSVLPQYQRQGVGGTLIRAMIDKATALGYGAILFFGRPEYYPQFGFKEASDFEIADCEGYNYPAFMGMELLPGYLSSAKGGRYYESDIYNDELNRDKAKAFDENFMIEM